MPNEIDELLAAGEQPDFLGAIVEDAQKSFRAAKMVLGLYKPETPIEAKELRRRFAADSALLAISAVPGGALIRGAKAAHAILGGALIGGTGLGVHAGIEQKPVLPAALTGALLGAVPGAIKAGAAGIRGIGEKVGTEIATEVIPRPGAPKALPQGLYEKIDPFDLPTRSRIQQQLLDPYSVPHTPEELLEELRESAINRAATGPEAIARGTAEVAEPTTIALRTQVRPRSRDAQGRFIAAKTVKELQVFTRGDPLSKAAADKVARQVFLDFVGGVEGGPGAQARIGRPASKRFGIARVREAGRGTPPQSVVPDVADTPEAIRIAATNEFARNFLHDLPDVGTVNLGKVWGDVTEVVQRTIFSSEDVLKKMGPAAAELGARMSAATDRYLRAAANSLQNIHAVRRLPIKERKNLAHVLNGDDVPMNPRVAELATVVRDELDRIGEAAKAAGLRVMSSFDNRPRPFQLRENYFPLHWDDKTIRKLLAPGPDHEEAIKRILFSQASMSREEAEAALRRYLSPHFNEFRYGHLQKVREFALPGWEDDPLKVLPSYFINAWRRIETATEFGHKDQLAEALIRRMASEGASPYFGRDVYRAFANLEPKRLKTLNAITRGINVISLLSTAGIVQLSQHSNTIALTGWKNYLRGMATFLSRNRPSQDWVARTGAYTQELIQDLVPAAPMLKGVELLKTSPTAWWLQTIGLTPLDKANRIVAAFAGRFYADDLARKLVTETSPRLLQQIERQLTQLGLNSSTIREAGGVLTAAQRSAAAQRASFITQFRGSVLDMPIAKNSAAGQFIYLFRTFAIQQTRFINWMLDEAFKKKNFAPLIRYLSATGVLTYSTGQTVILAKYGNDAIPGLAPSDYKPDLEGFRGALEIMAMGGAVGISYDALRGMYSGPDFLKSFLLGPTLTDVTGFFGRDLPELTKGNPTQMLHDTLKHTPLFGRRVANWLAPLD